MAETADTQYLLQWVQDQQSGLTAHLNYHLQNNTPQLSQIAQAYTTLKAELGY